MQRKIYIVCTEPYEHMPSIFYNPPALAGQEGGLLAQPTLFMVFYQKKKTLFMAYPSMFLYIIVEGFLKFSYLKLALIHVGTKLPATKITTYPLSSFLSHTTIPTMVDLIGSKLEQSNRFLTLLDVQFLYPHLGP